MAECSHIRPILGKRKILPPVSQGGLKRVTGYPKDGPPTVVRSITTADSVLRFQMASVQSLEEEFLTCSICTAVYDNPCTLQCGHSFCRKCVTKFIKTRQEAIQSKTIPCAFCWQTTDVPNPSRPAVTWADQIRPSLILQGLMDRFQGGTIDENGKKV